MELTYTAIYYLVLEGNSVLLACSLDIRPLHLLNSDVCKNLNVGFEEEDCSRTAYYPVLLACKRPGYSAQ